MSQYEVIELRYRAVGSSPFDNPAPVAAENELGSFLLANDVLRVRPNHCQGLEEARREIEPFLRAWELEAEFRYGAGTITFEFDDAETLSDPIQAIVPATTSLPSAGDASAGDTVVIMMMQYPEPPMIRMNDDITNIWRRFRTWRYGLGELGYGEPLLACAYYCLTVIELSAGGRMEAAKRYKIEPAVLRKLGELTSTRGDSTTARKSLPIGAAPLTKKEERWIGCAIKAIVWQMGVEAAASEPELLSLKDLPSLDA